MTFEIRMARPEEYDVAGDLTERSYRVDGFLDGPEDGYAAELRDASARAELSDLVVAVDETGAVLGTVTWCPNGSPHRELAQRPDQGEFRMLAVEPGARRHGVASALVRWCLDRARDDGLEEIVLCSLPQMSSAHRLYERFGFTRAPEMDWEPLPTVRLLGFQRPVAAPVAS